MISQARMNFFFKKIGNFEVCYIICNIDYSNKIVWTKVFKEGSKIWNGNSQNLQKYTWLFEISMKCKAWSIYSKSKLLFIVIVDVLEALWCKPGISNLIKWLSECIDSEHECM